MHTYIHIRYMHTYIHTFIHMHAYIRKHIYTYIQTHSGTSNTTPITLSNEQPCLLTQGKTIKTESNPGITCPSLARLPTSHPLDGSTPKFSSLTTNISFSFFRQHIWLTSQAFPLFSSWKRMASSILC